VLWLAIGPALAATACHDEPAPPAPAPPAPKAAPPPAPDPDAGPAPAPEGPWTGATQPEAAWLDASSARQAALEAEVQAHPDAVPALLELADRLADREVVDGNLDHLAVAEHLLGQAALWRPGDPEVVSRRERLLRQQGRFAQLAVEVELRAVAQPKRDARLQRDYAFALWEGGQYARALEQLEPVKPEGRTAEDFVREARMTLERGDAARADVLLRQAQALVEGDSPLPRAAIDLERARVRLHTGRYAEARTFLQAVLDRVPDHVEATLEMARVEVLLGDAASALRRYDALIARTGNPAAIGARAHLLHQQGAADAPAAVAAADQAWRTAIDQSPYLYLEGAVRFWIEDKPDQETLIRWSRQLKELQHNAVNVLLAARVQAFYGQKQWANELLREAGRMPVRTDDYFVALAAARQALGDAAGAQSALAEAHKLNPTVAAAP
jgi:tetratricopeptide (TPR) repeat protein